MVRLLLVCVACLLCLDHPAAAAETKETTQAKPNIQALLAYLKKHINTSHIPGMGVAVVSKDKVYTARGLGFRRLSTKQKADANTLFAIGSISKSLTAAALGVLADRKKLQWNRPVQRYLPRFRLRDEYATLHATSLDLLTHRTGLPRHDMVWYASGKSRDQLLNALPHLELSQPFRSTYQYNNLMYMVAGMVVEKLSGTSWEAFVKKELFAPLGMTNATFSVRQAKAHPNHAFPHRYKNNKTKEVPFRVIDAIGPAGSINASAKEMASWVQLQLGRGTFGKKKLLSPQTAAKLHTPHMIIPAKGVRGLFFKQPNLGHIMYGLGWMVTRFHDQPLIFHPGGIDGFTAIVAFMPTKDLGLVLLMNKGNEYKNFHMMLEAFERLLGLPSKPRVKKVEDLIKVLRQKGKKARSQVDTKRQKNTKATHPLQAFTGTYTHPAYGKVHLSINKQGRLRVDYQTKDFQFRHYHYNTFQAVNEKGEILSAKFNIHFRLGETGYPTQVHIPWQGGVKDIVYTRSTPKAPKKQTKTPKEPKKQAKKPKAPTTPPKSVQPSPPPRRKVASPKDKKVERAPNKRPQAAKKALLVKAAAPTRYKKRKVVLKPLQFRNFATFSAAVAEASRLKRPIFLDLFATWCVPCKRLEQSTFSHPLIYKLLDKYLVVRFDIDQPEGKMLVKTYQVKRFPATLMLDSAGIERERVIGYYTARYFRPPVVAALTNKHTYQKLLASAKTKPTPKLQLKLADRMVLRRQVDEARALYQQLWQNDPKNAQGIGAPALFGMARSYARASMYGYAVPWLQHFLKEFPNAGKTTIEAYRLMMYCYRKLGQRDDEKEVRGLFMKKYPGYPTTFK